jgi:uncharacterized protein YdaU (DUF1376 family)
MATLPYMPLYVADYLADTAHLNAAENGAYLALIMHYWRHGCLPIDDGSLRRISRMTSKEWSRSKQTIAFFFTDDWKHGRIDRELSKAKLKSDRRAQSGKMGGDAKALKLKETTLANATNLLEQTASKTLPSSSEPDIIEDKPSLRSGSSTGGPNGRCVDPPMPNGEPNLFVLVEPCRARLAARQESDQAVLDRVTDVWNQWAAAHGSPQVRYLTGQRAAHCRRRLADLKLDDGEAPEAAFGRLLSKCETSFFVRGSPRSPLKFDQLMQEGFLVKMMEGTFEWQDKKTEFQNRASRY